MAKQQATLDASVKNLVDALDANCELAKDLAGNELSEIAESVVGKILKEILKGARVIKDYCEIRKSSELQECESKGVSILMVLGRRFRGICVHIRWLSDCGPGRCMFRDSARPPS